MWATANIGVTVAILSSEETAETGTQDNMNLYLAFALHCLLEKSKGRTQITEDTITVLIQANSSISELSCVFL